MLEAAKLAGEPTRIAMNNKRILKECWGRGLKRRPLPQPPTLARRCKEVEIKSETVPKLFVTLQGFTPSGSIGPQRFALRRLPVGRTRISALDFI
jgi:hypothetical protein